MPIYRYINKHNSNKYEEIFRYYWSKDIGRLD